MLHFIVQPKAIKYPFYLIIMDKEIQIPLNE